MPGITEASWKFNTWDTELTFQVEVYGYYSNEVLEYRIDDPNVTNLFDIDSDTGVITYIGGPSIGGETLTNNPFDVNIRVGVKVENELNTRFGTITATITYDLINPTLEYKQGYDSSSTVVTTSDDFDIQNYLIANDEGGSGFKEIQCTLENGTVFNSNVMDTPGTYNIFCKAVDNAGNQSQNELSLTVTITSKPKFQVNPLDIFLSENESYALDLNTQLDNTPPEGITWGIVGNSGGFQLSNNNLTLQEKNYEDLTGYVFEATVSATNVDELSSNLNIKVTITNVNESPEIQTSNVWDFNTYDTDPFIQINASDPENRVLTYSLSDADETLFSIDEYGKLSYIGGPTYAGINVSESPFNVTIIVIINDGVNESEAIITAIITHDLMKPTIQLKDGKVSPLHIIIPLNANLDLSKYFDTADNEGGSGLSNAGIQYTPTFNASTADEHDLNCYVEDTAGNKSDYILIKVTVTADLPEFNADVVGLPDIETVETDGIIGTTKTYAFNRNVVQEVDDEFDLTTLIKHPIDAMVWSILEDNKNAFSIKNNNILEFGQQTYNSEDIDANKYSVRLNYNIPNVEMEFGGVTNANEITLTATIIEEDTNTTPSETTSQSTAASATFPNVILTNNFKTHKLTIKIESDPSNYKAAWAVYIDDKGFVVVNNQQYIYDYQDLIDNFDYTLDNPTFQYGVRIQYLKTDGQANSIAKYVGSFSIAKQIHLGYNECIFEDFSPNSCVRYRNKARVAMPVAISNTNNGCVTADNATYFFYDNSSCLYYNGNRYDLRIGDVFKLESNDKSLLVYVDWGDVSYTYDQVADNFKADSSYLPMGSMYWEEAVYEVENGIDNGVGVFTSYLTGTTKKLPIPENTNGDLFALVLGAGDVDLNDDETQAQTDSDKDRTDLNKKGVWTWINLGSINSSNNTVKLSDSNIRVAALRLKNGNAKFSIETSTDSTDNTQVKDSVTRGYSYEFQHTNMNHRTDKTFAKELSLDCGNVEMNYKVYLVSDWNTSVGNVTMDDTACEIVLSTDVAGFYESKTLYFVMFSCFTNGVTILTITSTHFRIKSKNYSNHISLNPGTDIDTMGITNQTNDIFLRNMNIYLMQCVVQGLTLSAGNIVGGNLPLSCMPIYNGMRLLKYKGLFDGVPEWFRDYKRMGKVEYVSSVVRLDMGTDTSFRLSGYFESDKLFVKVTGFDHCKVFINGNSYNNTNNIYSFVEDSNLTGQHHIEIQAQAQGSSITISCKTNNDDIFSEDLSSIFKSQHLSYE